MKRFFFLFFAALFSIAVFAQTEEVESDSLIFKDGKGMGGKTFMIDACASGIEESMASGKSEFKMDARKACTCMMDVIARNYTYKQFMDGAGKKGKDLFAQASKKDSPVYPEVMQCVLSSMQTKKSGSSSDDKESIKVPEEPASETGASAYDEAFDKSFMESCVKSAKNNKKMKDAGLNAQAYCSCTLEKIKVKKLTVAQLKELQDPQSELFSEIIVPCVTESIKK